MLDPLDGAATTPASGGPGAASKEGGEVRGEVPGEVPGVGDSPAASDEVALARAMATVAMTPVSARTVADADALADALAPRATAGGAPVPSSGFIGSLSSRRGTAPPLAPCKPLTWLWPARPYSPASYPPRARRLTLALSCFGARR